MARANRELIGVLRTTADRLCSTAPYQWGHMGMCNCGHLAQSITGLSHREIHESALAREGDWEQQAREYCPTSGLLIDHVIAAMLDLGLTRTDIARLEKLSDVDVIRHLPRERVPLRFNRRDDVALYLRTWAAILEEDLPLELEATEAPVAATASQTERRVPSALQSERNAIPHAPLLR